LVKISDERAESTVFCPDLMTCVRPVRPVRPVWAWTNELKDLCRKVVV